MCHTNAWDIRGSDTYVSVKSGEGPLDFRLNVLNSKPKRANTI